MSGGDLEPGDRCPFDGCDGALDLGPVEGCSCHISAPCGACVDNPLVCDRCGLSTDDFDKATSFADAAMSGGGCPVCGELGVCACFLPPSYPADHAPATPRPIGRRQ